jgi:hypothetical protein
MAVPDFADAHPGYGTVNRGRPAATRRNIAVSKSKEKLSPQEWQARHDAACAIVARKYCDMFEFWRGCRYKPCRSARRCRGNQGVCLESRWDSVPYEAGIAAQIHMEPKRRRTLTVSPARPTTIPLVRFACTIQRSEEPRPASAKAPA